MQHNIREFAHNQKVTTFILFYFLGRQVAYCKLTLGHLHIMTLN